MHGLSFLEGNNPSSLDSGEMEEYKLVQAFWKVNCVKHQEIAHIIA